MNRGLAGNYAGGATRGIAWGIDQIIILVTLGVTTWLISSTLSLFGISIEDCGASPHAMGDLVCYGTRWALAAFAALISPVYFIFFWTLSGQTIGNAILGIRVVRMDGKPMTVPRSVRRFVGYLVCFLTLGIGFALMLIDDRRQGLHDRLADTCVIYAWRGEENTETVQRVKNWLARRKRGAGHAPTADSGRS